MKDKNLTKSDIITSDIVYSIFTLVAGFCFVAIAVTSAFILACSVFYLYKSFTLASDKIAMAFILSVLMIACVALFAYVDYRIFNVVKKGLTKYLKERKELSK